VTSQDARGGPIISWSGWDPRGKSTAATDAAAAFSAVPGAHTEGRYELLAVAARGFRPPRFLRSIDVAAEHRDDVDAERFGPRIKQTWSLEYRRLAETGPPLTAPFAIYLLGVNPPPDATDEDLRVFNNFYTDVHLPEVAARRHALRAERYEFVREVKAPYQGAPRFLAVYEVDEESASERRHTGPPYWSGPEVWQRHTTPWRLWYRRLDSPPTPAVHQERIESDD
jgi:hypothetical protein